MKRIGQIGTEPWCGQCKKLRTTRMILILWHEIVHYMSGVSFMKIRWSDEHGKQATWQSPKQTDWWTTKPVTELFAATKIYFTTWHCITIDIQQQNRKEFIKRWTHQTSLRSCFLNPRCIQMKSIVDVDDMVFRAYVTYHLFQIWIPYIYIYIYYIYMYIYMINIFFYQTQHSELWNRSYTCTFLNPVWREFFWWHKNIFAFNVSIFNIKTA